VLKVIGLGVLIMLAGVGVLSILFFVLSFRPGRWNDELALQKDSTVVSGKLAYTRFSLPRQIVGTRYSRCDVLLVDPEAKSKFEGLGSYASRSGEESGSIVNVAIFGAEAEDCRLVFTRPALLREINRSHVAADSLRGVLLYEAYVDDTNGDGLLGSKDNLGLFASDLDGRNLVPITPDSVSVAEWEFADGFQKLAISVRLRPKGSSPEDHPVLRRLLWYDLKQRELCAHPALDRLLDETKRIMAR